MTGDEWNTIALLLDKGFKWREPFGQAHETTYRLLLDGYDSEQVATALRALADAGQVFGPTPGEIIGRIRSDPSRPTADEMFRLIYGPRGVLFARAPYVNGEFEFSDDEAALRRARGMHPWLAAFVERQTVPWLRRLEIDHEDFGDLKRKELRESWAQFCAIADERGVATLAANRRGELGKFDPLAALGGRREITSGEEQQP